MENATQTQQIDTTSPESRTILKDKHGIVITEAQAKGREKQLEARKKCSQLRMELFERYIIACEAKTRNMAEDNKYRLIVEYVRKSFESKKAKGIGGSFSTSCKVAYGLEEIMYCCVPWNASGSITYSRRPFEEVPFEKAPDPVKVKVPDKPVT